MHNVYDCIESFSSLMDTKYHLVLGRKCISVSLDILFDKRDCYHLMGLQYLKDRPELNRDRGKIFDEIKKRVITCEHIESSDLYHKIKGRVDMLPFLETMIDSNDTIFKYNKKLNAFSLIQVEYLMKNRMFNKNMFVFLSKNKNGAYFCRSFFPEENKDYTNNQASWTLLYKEKIKISTNESIILCNKLK